MQILGTGADEILIKFVLLAMIFYRAGLSEDHAHIIDDLYH